MFPIKILCSERQNDEGPLTEKPGTLIQSAKSKEKDRFSRSNKLADPKHIPSSKIIAQSF
jgi:hypothetical protein